MGGRSSWPSYTRWRRCGHRAGPQSPSERRGRSSASDADTATAHSNSSQQPPARPPPQVQASTELTVIFTAWGVREMVPPPAARPPLAPLRPHAEETPRKRFFDPSPPTTADPVQLRHAQRVRARRLRQVAAIHVSGGSPPWHNRHGIVITLASHRTNRPLDDPNESRSSERLF